MKLPPPQHIATFARRVPELLQRADETLSKPPAKFFIKRNMPENMIRIARFALPKGISPTENQFGEMTKWQRTTARRHTETLMLAQWGRGRAERLSGYPVVTCVRFSSVPCDVQTTWNKFAVDTLVKMGFFKDDAPQHIDKRSWWEPARQGWGFVLVDVWEAVE